MPLFRAACALIGRAVAVSLIALLAVPPTLPAASQTLDVTLTPLGSAASNRPLPVGAMPSVAIGVRNGGKRTTGPVTLKVRFDGISALEAKGWRKERDALVGKIAKLVVGARAQRIARFKVEHAPMRAARITIAVEARADGGVTGSGKADFSVADCVGAYRAELEALREGPLQAVRDAAKRLRTSDRTLPRGRAFRATGARRGAIAAAERLAATFAARRGADPQMATERFRFLIVRWTGELNAFARQPANPGMCADNYYQIAGYRQGLLPITKRIDAVHAAAEDTLAAARVAMKAAPEDDAASVVRRAIGLLSAEPDDAAGEQTPLGALAGARASLKRGRDLDKEETQMLSLAETAAWLAETDRRGQALAESIEAVLATIGAAHRESCVCAF